MHLYTPSLKFYEVKSFTPVSVFGIVVSLQKNVISSYSLSNPRVDRKTLCDSVSYLSIFMLFFCLCFGCKPGSYFYVYYCYILI